MDLVRGKLVFRVCDQVRLKADKLYRDRLEDVKIINEASYRYPSLQEVNNKEAHQTVWIPRLVCTFVVHLQLARFSRIMAHISLFPSNLYSRS